jgi:hypothetical protein
MVDNDQWGDYRTSMESNRLHDDNHRDGAKFPNPTSSRSTSQIDESLFVKPEAPAAK